MLFADLHIHTCYSDGTMTPEEVIKAAQAAGVGLLAVSDHNVLGGSKELCRLLAAGGSGLRWTTGVELDTRWGDYPLHLLGYGCDLEHPALNYAADRSAEIQEEANRQVISRLNAPGVSLEDYDTFSYNRQLGGWKALHYFVAKGLVKHLWEGFDIYKRYGTGPILFPLIRDYIDRIHAAGGMAVLAHPGEAISPSPEEALPVIKQLVSLGLDGVECYYSRHSPELTEALLAFCRANGLLITAGSDCHGDFCGSGGPIGATHTPEEALALDGIRIYSSK